MLVPGGFLLAMHADSIQQLCRLTLFARRMPRDSTILRNQAKGLGDMKTLGQILNLLRIQGNHPSLDVPVSGISVKAQTVEPQQVFLRLRELNSIVTHWSGKRLSEVRLR